MANACRVNSVYQTIDRLLRAGLIAVRETSREENRPERTVYEPTDAGRATLRDWMATMLSTPPREFPEFPAALAFMPVLPPDEVSAALRERLAALRARLSELDGEFAEARTFLPRVFLVETEYQRAVLQAESDYVRGLVDAFQSREVTWDYRL